MRQYRISRPPAVGDPRLSAWLDNVFDAINGLPAFSTFSGDPNGRVEAQVGTLGFDSNSASTGILWVNTSGTSTSWSSIVYG